MNNIAKIYQIGKTVLTTRDMALIWQETNPKNLKEKIAYYVRRKDLIRLTRGVFAKSKKYNPRELATSLYRPSYLSFETALREAGIIFQHSETIFVAGPWTKDVQIDKVKMRFRKLKKSVLYRPEGILNREGYSIAGPERAFLDMIYLFPNYYFDNLRGIDWEKCFELAKIYENQQLFKRLKKYQKNYDE